MERYLDSEMVGVLETSEQVWGYLKGILKTEQGATLQVERVVLPTVDLPVFKVKLGEERAKKKGWEKKLEKKQEDLENLTVQLQSFDHVWKAMSLLKFFIE